METPIEILVDPSSVYPSYVVATFKNFVDRASRGDYTRSEVDLFGVQLHKLASHYSLAHSLAHSRETMVECQASQIAHLKATLVKAQQGLKQIRTSLSGLIAPKAAEETEETTETEDASAATTAEVEGHSHWFDDAPVPDLDRLRRELIDEVEKSRSAQARIEELEEENAMAQAAIVRLEFEAKLARGQAEAFKTALVADKLDEEELKKPSTDKLDFIRRLSSRCAHAEAKLADRQAEYDDTIWELDAQLSSAKTSLQAYRDMHYEMLQVHSVREAELELALRKAELELALREATSS